MLFCSGQGPISPALKMMDLRRYGTGYPLQITSEDVVRISGRKRKLQDCGFEDVGPSPEKLLALDHSVNVFTNNAAQVDTINTVTVSAPDEEMLDINENCTNGSETAQDNLNNRDFMCSAEKSPTNSDPTILIHEDVKKAMREGYTLQEEIIPRNIFNQILESEKKTSMSLVLWKPPQDNLLLNQGINSNKDDDDVLDKEESDVKTLKPSVEEDEMETETIS